MRKPESPCLRCDDRRPGCHGECEAWKEYEAQMQLYKDNLYGNKRRAHAGIAPFNQQKENYKKKRRQIK